MAVLSIDAKLVRPLVGSIVTAFDAAEALSVGDLVYVNSTGKVAKTDADSAPTVTGQLGIVVAGTGNGAGLPSSTGAIASGERVSVCTFGRVAIGGTLDMTKQYFASNTAGKLDDAAGTVTRRVGSAESASVLFFNPNTTAPTS